MNKVKSAVLITIDGQVIGEVESWEDARVLVDEHLNDYDGKILPENRRVAMYNYVGLLTTETNELTITKELGKVWLGDENVGDAEDIFTITSGDYNGMTFSDQDELQDFLNEKVASGEIDLEDVKDMEIDHTITQDISFKDAEADEPEYSINTAHGVASSIAVHFGDTFVLASEAPTPVDVKTIVQEQLHDADLVNVRRDIQEMTDQEVQEELFTLQTRSTDLFNELTRRRMNLEA